ncbi:MAG: signal peptidase I [Candidatus Dormibacteria bacterium]
MRLSAARLPKLAALLALAAIALAWIVFVAGGWRTVTEDGTEMSPTLAKGQSFLASDTWVSVFGIARGDIVAFHPPPPGNTSLLYLSRVIGMPGEVVSATGGVVQIEFGPLHEPYIRSDTTTAFAPCRVPPGHYFLLNDSRAGTSDSRLFGAVDRSQVLSHVLITSSTAISNAGPSNDPNWNPASIPPAPVCR